MTPITKQLNSFFDNMIQREDSSPTVTMVKKTEESKQKKSTSEEIIQIISPSNPPSKK